MKKLNKMLDKRVKADLSSIILLELMKTEVQVKDYTKEIDTITKQLNNLIEIKEKSEYLVNPSGYTKILGNFETTARLTTLLIESYYTEKGQ